MNDMVVNDLNGALLHVKKALLALDDTHLLDDERLDDLFARLVDVEVELKEVVTEYENVDKKYWDTDIGDY